MSGRFSAEGYDSFCARQEERRARSEGTACERCLVWMPDDPDYDGHSPILCEACQVSHCDICGQPCQLAELECGECEDCRAIG